MLERPVKSPGRRLFAYILSATLVPMVAAVGLTSAHADSYPNRPVRFVVPFTTGGSADILARMLGDQLTRRLGQAFVVDNKPGGATAIGAQLVARAQPDGYTLMLSTSSTFTINPAMSVDTKLPYDPVNDFVPVAQVTDLPVVLVGNSAAPFQSLVELLAADERSPNTYDYASFGTGTGSHLAGEIFKRATGARIVHIPFPGTQAAVNAVLAGQVPLTFTSVSSALPLVKAGKLKAYGLMSPSRTRLMPDVPTFAELGYPSSRLVGWNVVVAPRGTPQEVVQVLESNLRAIMSDPQFVRKVLDAGLEPSYSKISDWAAVLGLETSHYRSIVEAAGLRKN